MVKPEVDIEPLGKFVEAIDPWLEQTVLVGGWKGVSSRVLRLKRPDLVRRYWKGVLWSPSYFAASCGGIQ